VPSDGAQPLGGNDTQGDQQGKEDELLHGT
jgi:hypothetical protein